MTDTPAAAGTYLVLDPAVRAAIGEMLRTAGTLLDTAATPPAAADDSAVEHLSDELGYAQRDLGTARERIAKLEKQNDEVGAALGQAISQLERERSAHAATRAGLDRQSDLASRGADEHTRTADELARTIARLTETEVDLEHTRAELAQARAALETAKKATTAAAKPPHGNSARGKDRKAWVGISEWIEREASTQGSEAAKAMRIVRREVDREITKLYGEPGKAAS